MALRVVRGDKGQFYLSHRALVIDGDKEWEVDTAWGLPGCAWSRH